MSEEFALDLSSVISSAAGNGAFAVIPSGAVISEFAIEKVKLDPSRKLRVAFLSDAGIAFQQHYVPGFGTVICNGNECCKRLANMPNVQTSRRVLFPVLTYEGLADPVRATVRDVREDTVKVKVFVVHYKTYNKRMADSFATGEAMTRDWILTSTTGQFAGGLESMAGSTSCLYKQNPEIVKSVYKTLNDNKAKLFEAVGEFFNAEKFDAFLANGGASATQNTNVAPAIPSAPSAVDQAALEDNFEM